MSTNYADVAWYGQMRQSADDAARASYQQSMANNEGERVALDKAKFAWQQTLDKAGLTGMYEGAPTQAAMQYGANTFGTWGAPQQGQETLAAQQQRFGQGYQTAGLYGQAYGPGGPEAGTQTMAGREQDFTQGLRTQQEQRAAQAQGQTQAQDYLRILAGLRGPADWMKYQEVLGATPGGMRDLYAAAMGQYVPGGGATTGVQPSAANLSTMMQQMQGQQATMGGPQQQLYNANVYQPAQGGYGQNVYGQQGQQEQMLAQLQGKTVGGPVGGQQPGGMQNYALQQQQNAYGGGTNAMGAQQPGQPQANQMNLPAPNQIAMQSWNNMAPSSKEMMMGQYESQGWHRPDVEAMMNQSLPKYASNAPTAGTFRLR